jgi:hypothetical protein
VRGRLEQGQGRVAHAHSETEGLSGRAIAKHSSLAKGSLNECRAVFAEKRPSLNLIQKRDDVFHDILIHLTKRGRRHGHVPASVIACFECFEWGPVQSINEVLARSAEQLLDNEFPAVLENDVQPSMHCERWRSRGTTQSGEVHVQSFHGPDDPCAQHVHRVALKDNSPQLNDTTRSIE